MKQPDILTEIARIEREIARLASELQTLRERFDAGAASSRRHTMAFSAPPPPMDAPSAIPAIPPPPRSRARGRSLVPPPPVVVRDLQALAVDSVPPPPQPASRNAPRSSIRAISVAESEAPESAPSADSSAREHVEAGRYGFVAEPKARTATRAR
jgi:hypothetical protein